MRELTVHEAIPHRPEADAFDVRAATLRVLHAVLSHKLVVIACCLTTLAMVYLYKITFPPVYKAAVLVQAEAPDDKAREFYYKTWNLFRESELTAQGELMTAGPVVEKVLGKLNIGYDDVYHTHLKQLAYLWRISEIGKFYRSIKHRLFPPLESPFKPTPEQQEHARVVDAFSDGVDLVPVPDTHLARLEVKGPTPRVFEYANVLIDTYLEHRRDVALDEADTAYESLLAEVNRFKSERNNYLARKTEFDKKHGILLGFESDKLLMNRWQEIELEAGKLRAKRDSLRAQLAVVRDQLRKQPDMMTKSRTTAINNLHDLLQTKAFELHLQLERARTKFQPDSPEVAEIQRALSDTEAQMARQPDRKEANVTRVSNRAHEDLAETERQTVAQIASIEAQLATNEKTAADLKTRLDRLPDLWAESLKLQNRIDGAAKTFEALQEKLTIAEVSRATALTAPSPIRVVQYAAPPADPIWPRMKILIAIALFFGLTGGIGLALLLNEFRDRVTRDWLAYRADFDVYATVDFGSLRSAAMIEGTPYGVNRLRLASASGGGPVGESEIHG